MINAGNSIAIILVCGIVTLALRGGPFLIWGGNRKIPEYVLWLGKILPYAIMMMLVVFSFRNTSLTDMGGEHGWLPAAIGLAVTSGTYVWKKSTLLAILIGTIVFMVLVRIV